MNRNRKILVYDFLQRFAKIGTKYKTRFHASLFLNFALEIVPWDRGRVEFSVNHKDQKKTLISIRFTIFFLFFLGQKVTNRKNIRGYSDLVLFETRRKELSYIFYKVSSIFSLSYHLYFVYFTFPQSKMQIRKF